MQCSARKIGFAIGIAFQVYDDILNFTVGLDEENKPILTDFRQGIYTLPLLLAKEKDEAAILPFLEKPEMLNREECLELAHLVYSLGGIQGALDFANGLTDFALREVGKFPQSRNREILEKAIGDLLQRNY